MTKLVLGINNTAYSQSLVRVKWPDYSHAQLNAEDLRFISRQLEKAAILMDNDLHVCTDPDHPMLAQTILTT
jgi:hypothetical protein